MQEIHPPLSLKSAANFLGISRSSLYRLIAQGELASFKIGRRTLITRTEMARFMDARIAAGAKTR